MGLPHWNEVHLRRLHGFLCSFRGTAFHGTWSAVCGMGFGCCQHLDPRITAPCAEAISPRTLCAHRHCADHSKETEMDVMERDSSKLMADGRVQRQWSLAPVGGPAPTHTRRGAATPFGAHHFGPKSHEPRMTVPRGPAHARRDHVSVRASTETCPRAASGCGAAQTQSATAQRRR